MKWNTYVPLDELCIVFLLVQLFVVGADFRRIMLINQVLSNWFRHRADAASNLQLQHIPLQKNTNNAAEYHPVHRFAGHKCN